MGKQAVNKRPKPTARKKFSAAYKRKIAERIAELDEIRPANPKAAQAIALMKSWLADESGYDEETLPMLKKALDDERKRVGARRLFDG
jgi:hypothetical protein